MLSIRKRSCSSALSISWKRKFRAIRVPRNTISATRLALRTAIGAAQSFSAGSACSSATNSKAAVIIYAWVNDENTLRKAGGANDPYRLFGGMLRKGRPPDDWAALLKEATAYKPPKSEERA